MGRSIGLDAAERHTDKEYGAASMSTFVGVRIEGGFLEVGERYLLAAVVA